MLTDYLRRILYCYVHAASFWSLIAAARPQGFVPSAATSTVNIAHNAASPLASSFLSSITPQASLGCTASCTIRLPQLVNLEWSSFVPTTTLVQATVVVFVDSINETSTVTYWNEDLPAGYTPPEKLHDGRVISTVTLTGPAKVFETVLTYPTPYIEQITDFAWEGILPTQHGNLSICSTAERGYVTLPSYPLPSGSYTHSTDHPSPGGDELGDNYRLVPTTFAYDESPNYETLISGDGAFAACQHATEPGPTVHPSLDHLASYITITTTLWQGRVNASTALAHTELPVTGVDGPGRTTRIETSQATIIGPQQGPSIETGVLQPSPVPSSYIESTPQRVDGPITITISGDAVSARVENTQTGSLLGPGETQRVPGPVQTQSTPQGGVLGIGGSGIADAIASGGANSGSSSTSEGPQLSNPGSPNQDDDSVFTPQAQGSSGLRPNTGTGNSGPDAQAQVAPNDGSNALLGAPGAGGSGQLLDSTAVAISPINLGPSTIQPTLTSIRATLGNGVVTTMPAIIVAGQTITPGATATIDNVPLVLQTSDGSIQLVVSGSSTVNVQAVTGASSTVTLASQITTPPTITIGPTIITGTDGYYIVGSQTLSFGGTITVGSGSSATKIVLTTNSLGQTVALVGANTLTMVASTGDSKGTTAKSTAASDTTKPPPHLQTNTSRGNAYHHSPQSFLLGVLSILGMLI